MKIVKRGVIFFVVLTFLSGLLPSAFAANEENVLLSVMHVEADTYTLSGSGRDITLHVRNSYPDGTLDLTNGLNIDWNKNLYTSVVATPASATVAIDGTDVVNLTVTFNRLTDPAGTSQWTTTYHVKAERADSVAPIFSGTVTKEILYSATNHTVSVSSADLLDKYIPNDSEDIGSVSISGSNPTFGAIRVGTNNYDFNTHPLIAIDADNPDATIFTFEATSNGLVSYNISAYAGADTSHPIGNVVLTILSYRTPVITTPVTENISKGTVLTFTEAYFANRCNLYGVSLESVEITPTSSTFGTWYLGTKSFTAATVVPVSQLSALTFTANAAGTVAFTWRVTARGSTSSSAAGTIVITSPKLTLEPYTESTSILKGNTHVVQSENFIYTPLTASMSYIKISTIPPATDGYLYLTTALAKNDTYGYPAIAANTALTTSAVIPASYLDYLRLATKTASTNTAVTFKWTATADAKITTAVWADAVTYTVPFISADTLTLLTDMNIPLAFSTPVVGNDTAADRIASNFSLVTGASLSYITFTVPDKNFGTLFLNYDYTKKTGTAVAAVTKYYAAKSPNLSKITFVPAKDYTGTGEISYSAYTESGAYVTGKIKITVSGSNGGIFSYTTDKNSPLQFNAADFQAAFLSASGKALSHVNFLSLSSSDGYLCYNYNLSGDYDSAVTYGSPYYAYKASYLSLVTFIPYKDKTGPVVINFYAYSTENTVTYSGKLYIFIVDSAAGIVQYSLKENSSIILSAEDFSNEFIGVTGSVMSYVTFTPPAATSGSMYYQYDAETQTGTKVTSAIKYYDGKNPDLSEITFVPAKDLTGTVVVPYTAYSTTGVAYTGKLKFTMFSGTDVITYNTESGKPVPMNAGDFTDAFYVNSNGRSLSYVTFETPPASCGKFYYNYTSPSRYDYAVTSDKKFYVYASPYLSNVSFVPQEGYTGSFSVTYTGYTSGGTSVSGKMKITVSGVQGGSIIYETNSTTPVTFKTTDFTMAFAGKTGSPLSYVRFTLPSSTFGTLYERYNALSTYKAPVYATTNYNVNASTYISDVTFVPNPNFSGVLAINYTGYDAYGYSYAGTVLITVNSSDIGTITYSTNLNRPVLFDSDDFNNAFLAKTGSSLYSVTFTLPSVTTGKLYLGYISPASYTSEVSASAKYYRSYTPLISGVSFVPATGYYGTVTIPYTAYTANNAAYNGKIVINIDTEVPYTDLGNHVWAQDAIDYLYQQGIITDDGSGLYRPYDNTTRGDFMLMIVNAFQLSGGKDNFSDVPVGSPYYNAIAAAKALDIARGTGDGLFHPEWGLTRQDAMVILVRTFKNTGSPLTPGTISDLARFSDVADVSDYAIADMAALVKIGFIQGTGDKLNPKSMISRAETAMILYRILTM